MLFNNLATSPSPFHELEDVQEYTSAEEAVRRIKEIYNDSIHQIQHAFSEFLKGDLSENKLPPIKKDCYPFLGIRVDRKDLNLDPRHSYGVIVEPGVYGGTLTRPDIFEKYYYEQISLLIQRHNVPVYIGTSDHPIPLPFALDVHDPMANTSTFKVGELWKSDTDFVLPSLSRISDSIANCTYSSEDGLRPISLFSGERVDYSLHRLHHYTGTSPEHFQGFILLTNYQRYIEEFVKYGLQETQSGREYDELVIPGDVTCQSLDDIPTGAALPQMPAYHLKRKDGMGITFINIGIGPSNAKNITDHLAVLRPHCWIMLGHCAGLRLTQRLGDYVLAHGYVRTDHVLDQDLPLWIPVPPIAELQVALQEAAANVSHKRGQDLKIELRTGTVVTTDDRNWELRTKELYEHFKQSRAIALDMESATVAANGFRFRVPYGTLLCVSDKPIHGELKLRGMANNFYRERVNQHLKIGLEAIHLLREQGVDQLHSRKLRGFDEPPFR